MSNDGRPHETPEVLPLVMLSPQTLVIASLSVAVLLVGLLVFFSKKSASSKGNSFLLVGPSDVGKTTILSKLIYSRTLPTHTSLQTNSSILNLSNNKSIRVIDVPGHPRIRDQFQEFLPDAKVIAFVVDSSTVSRNSPAVAEHLHHILHAITSLPPSQSLPSLLVICNKVDLLKTSSSSGSPADLAVARVKTILERELEKRRVAQTDGVGVEGLGEEGERLEMGGLESGDSNGGIFKFDEWEGGEVVFLGTSVKPGGSEKDRQINEKSDSEDDGLVSLENWLEDNV